MSETLLYFAYGSNMYPPRLAERTPSCRIVSTAALPRHALRFHKRGQDGSGKCDAFYTGAAEDIVLGVVFEVARRDRVLLDVAEGVGRGYDVARLDVQMGTQSTSVFCYLAQRGHIDATLRPFDWYLALVLKGARFHRLPRGYIESIDTLPAQPDPDQRRQRRHLSLAMFQ